VTPVEKPGPFDQVEPVPYLECMVCDEPVVFNDFHGCWFHDVLFPLFATRTHGHVAEPKPEDLERWGLA
jgi:hypothetical protein